MVPALVLALLVALPATTGASGLPLRLEDTGIDSARRVAFAPQHPLWTDGATKQRWISLPSGGAIDATKPDAWAFPRGTRLWKEFALAGRKIETRYIEHGRDGRWRFASYQWNEAGTQAMLAPERGAAVATAQGNYRIPGRHDCLACHGSSNVPVLGLSAVQANAESLRALVARGWLRGDATARPIEAASDVERAALGYLHGNCAHCHNTTPNRVPLALTLQQRAGDPQAARAEVLRSLVGAPARYVAHDAKAAVPVVTPGHPEASVLVHRMATRDPRIQMPPLGTDLVDEDGLALVKRWIAHELSPKEKQP